MSEALHPEETVTTVIFVRHGHTRQTESGQLYSDPGAVLSDRGKAQAEQIARWLVRENPDGLLSSAADRVKATAEIISRELALAVETLDDLNEQHVGLWEGRTYLDIKKSEPDAYHQWCADPIRNSPPGGESILGMFERVNARLAAVVQQFQGRKLLLVTHAGVIRSAIAGALGIPIDNFWRISIPTASVSKIDYSPSFATLHYMSVRD